MDATILVVLLVVIVVLLALLVLAGVILARELARRGDEREAEALRTLAERERLYVLAFAGGDIDDYVRAVGAEGSVDRAWETMSDAARLEGMARAAAEAPEPMRDPHTQEVITPITG